MPRSVRQRRYLAKSAEMATRKPVKRGPNAGPPNPCSEPGCFIVRGKSWVNEHGEEIIDEDGDVIYDDELEQFENYLYDEDDFRLDGTPRAKAVPLYELRWCPVTRKTKKHRKL